MRRIVRTSAGTAFLWVVLLAMVPWQAFSQAPTNDSAAGANTVPRLMQFSGVLKDYAGKPLVGVQGVTFALYREREGGSALWLETQNVTADAEGRFAALLGATTSEGVPLEGFSSGESRWLGVQAQAPGEAEQPRVLLVSVPYALKAADAETLGGKPLSAFLLAEASSDSPSRDREGATASSDSAVGETAEMGLPTAAATTLDRVARFDGAGMPVDSDITNTGGKVGIGSTAPATALDVSGTIRAVLGPGAPFGAYLMPTGGAANNFRFGFGNNLFFDGTNWRTRGDGANNAGSAILTDIGLGHLQVFTLPSTGATDQVISNASFANFEKLRITGDGNVGIGTASPTQKLDVNGNARVSGNLTVDTDTLFVDATNNRVGVGTTSPNARLHVAGGPINAAGGLIVVGNAAITGTPGVNGVIFPDGTTQTSALVGTPANLAIRGINYITGCDNCSVLVDADDQKTFYQNVIGNMTINSVTCFSDTNTGNPTINIQRDDSSATDMLSTNLVCTTAGATKTTPDFVSGENNLSLGHMLDFVMFSAGGTAKRVTVVIKATVN